MKTHDELIQGSPAWHAHRTQHFNASDAPAMMGASAYKTRTQLLHEMATGQVPDVDAATQRRFDDGHRFEALARPLAEEIIGMEMYPVVGSEGKMSASFDGLSMCETTAFEHKTLNANLRDAMPIGYIDIPVLDRDFPAVYRIQMEQQLMVSGAERCLFMASSWNGDELMEERHAWYYPDQELRSAILQGWTQFAIDLENYIPSASEVKAVAAPQFGLPAVSIQVNGSIALIDNLQVFGVALTAYVERINKKPETDQDFADLEATVKTLKNAEDALDSAETNALAQTDSIDAMRRTVALYRDTARTNRLLIEKLVKAEKENRRTAIVSDAVSELVSHVKKLNDRLGKPYMPTIASDFPGAVKGLKSLDSMKDKVSTELARCKIEANSAADRIHANLATLRELASEHTFLFADTAQIVLKANDDLTALVKSRIAEHMAAEAARVEAQRIQIEASERAKAQAAERTRADAEIAAATAKARADAQAQALADAETRRASDAAIAKAAQPEAKAQVCDSVQVGTFSKQADDTAATMRLGQICERLGFTITADFLSELGFEPCTTEKNAKLYKERMFPLICKTLVRHIQDVAQGVAA